MGKGFASPAQYRGADIKPALVSNWRALTTHLNSYVPTFNADGVTLALPGDLTVAGALTTGTAIDHGGLGGKADDDHTQYYNAARHTKAVHDALALDHGALGGKGDDDHTIYSKADGTRAFTGVVSGITPTVDAHLATKGYADGMAKTTRVYDSTGVTTLASSTALTTLYWDSETIDEGGWHSTSTNTHRIQPDVAGLYLLQAGVYFSDTVAAGYRHLLIYHSAAGAVAFDYRPGNTISQAKYHTCSAVVRAAANEYFYVTVRQNSGSNSAIPGGASFAWFSGTRLGG